VARILDGIAHLSFVCGPWGEVEIVNPPWLHFTGLTAEQSLGEGWRSTIHSDDLVRFEDRWNEVIAQGESGEIEACLRRHDGVFAAAIFHLMPLSEPSGGVKQWYVSTTFGKILSSSEEAALGVQREFTHGQLRTIVDAIPILAWSTAKDVRGEFLNKRWLDYTGLGLQEAICYGWRAIIHPDDLGPLFECWLSGTNSGGGQLGGWIERPRVALPANPPDPLERGIDFAPLFTPGQHTGVQGHAWSGPRINKHVIGGFRFCAYNGPHDQTEKCCELYRADRSGLPDFLESLQNVRIRYATAFFRAGKEAVHGWHHRQSDVARPSRRLLR
jgi:PAS domain-containing protein